MLSMQHIMTSMLNGYDTCEREYIAAVVFPDAIRAFTGERELSHFEENPKTGDISWMRFPNYMSVDKAFMEEWKSKDFYVIYQMILKKEFLVKRLILKNIVRLISY